MNYIMCHSDWKCKSYYELMWRGSWVVKACGWWSEGAGFISFWWHFETLPNLFTPHCQFLDTISNWSLLSGACARRSKISHTAGKYVACRRLPMKTVKWTRLLIPCRLSTKISWVVIKEIVRISIYICSASVWYDAWVSAMSPEKYRC